MNRNQTKVFQGIFEIIIHKKSLWETAITKVQSDTSLTNNQQSFKQYTIQYIFHYCCSLNTLSPAVVKRFDPDQHQTALYSTLSTCLHICFVLFLNTAGLLTYHWLDVVIS